MTQVLNDGTNNYIYGNDRIAQVNTGTEYFLGDALGSVRQLTNSNGAVTYAGAYDPYGVTTQTHGASQTAYGYTNEYTSQGLVYLQARYYAPSIGRFLTRDPSGAEANLYLYASGNPIIYTDPSGLFSKSIVAATIDPFHTYYGDFEAVLDIAKYTAEHTPARPKWGFIAALLDGSNGDRLEAMRLNIWGSDRSIYGQPLLENMVTANLDSNGYKLLNLYDLVRDSYPPNQTGIGWNDARYYVLYSQQGGMKKYVDGNDVNISNTNYPDFKIASLNIADSIKEGLTKSGIKLGPLKCLTLSTGHIVDRYGQVYEYSTFGIGPGFTLGSEGVGFVYPRYPSDRNILRKQIESVSFGLSGSFFGGMSASYSPSTGSEAMTVSFGLQSGIAGERTEIRYLYTDGTLAWDWADQWEMGTYGSPPTIFRSTLQSWRPNE